ncbi:MAG: VOC family protein [Asgard group archaeon]|nr:VOC family protein [Asgard group archaeon]
MEEESNISIETHIIGIGGIFFKSKNPDELVEWYKSTLGFSVQVPYTKDDTAISFRWKSFDGENQNTVWAPFKEDTTYFSPSQKNFMINYIVKDLDGLMLKLEKKGIKSNDSIKEYPYGRFTSIMDIEGNKIEFWEPNREYFKDKY